MFQSIADRAVIVTGSSKGIGKGIAKVFASRGAKVALVGRDEKALKAVEAEIKASGGTAISIVADVSQIADVKRMVAATVEQFGGVDILCANAGIFPSAKLPDLTVETWDQTMEVNVRGSFLCVQAVVPHMIRAGRGRIVLTSSITGPVTGYPGWMHYGASKAAQLGMMRTAAIELAAHKITINAVLPGNVPTEGVSQLAPDYVKKMTDAVPQGRLGTADDVGFAALFFASDEASYITGQTLIVDGGQVLPESHMALEEMR